MQNKEVKNPRSEIENLIAQKQTEELLHKAAQLHGHYCPGLAMGVIAAAEAMRLCSEKTDGLEDLLAIVETNNCFADGIQFVTGCSFGNNGLIFKDLGKIAVTLVSRNGNGYRLVVKNDAKQHIRKTYEDFSDSYNKVVKQQSRSNEDIQSFKLSGYKKAVAMMKIDASEVFSITTVKNIDTPPYAPSHESIICDRCGEETMASRTIVSFSEKLCISCSDSKYYQLDGDGISNM